MALFSNIDYIIYSKIPKRKNFCPPRPAEHFPMFTVTSPTPFPCQDFARFPPFPGLLITNCRYTYIGIFKDNKSLSHKTSVGDPCHIGTDQDPDSRTRSPVLVTNGSECGSCSFRQWPSRSQQKIFFFSLRFYASSFLKVHLHRFLEIISR
jgi:hypothetical protein